MENATKALLIAAAVLIAIVLVALGVNLLSSTGDTTEDAGKVAEQIGSSTSSAVSSLGTALGKLEGVEMTTFYLVFGDEKIKITWPEGYTAEYLLEKNMIDKGIWSIDNDVICYNNDYELGNVLNASEWIPTEGEEVTAFYRPGER